MPNEKLNIRFVNVDEDEFILIAEIKENGYAIIDSVQEPNKPKDELIYEPGKPAAKNYIASILVKKTAGSKVETLYFNYKKEVRKPEYEVVEHDVTDHHRHKVELMHNSILHQVIDPKGRE